MRAQGPSASRPILVGRLVAVAVAAAAVAWSFVPSRGGERAPSRAAAADDDDGYACPMHAQVTARDPGGRCPICRMALQRIAAPAPAAAPPPTAFAAQAQRRSFTWGARAGAWVRPDGAVEAVFASGDLLGLAAGQRAQFFRAADPRTAIDVVLAPGAPRPWDRSRSKVDFRPQPGSGRGSPGETGWVVVAPITRDVLVVPSNAVLQSPRGARVLAAGEGGRFQSRPIEVGKVIDGVAVVMSGLREDERVVVGDTFFVDAGQRLAASRRLNEEEGR